MRPGSMLIRSAHDNPVRRILKPEICTSSPLQVSFNFRCGTKQREMLIPTKVRLYMRDTIAFGFASTGRRSNKVQD